MTWFSSWEEGDCSFAMSGLTVIVRSPRAIGRRVPSCRDSGGSHALLQARLDEVVEVTVEHRLGVADLDVGPQILDARLIEHVGAYLVAPGDVGLGVLHGLALLVPLAQ